MKDIFEILKENGIEVEESKHKEIRKIFAENYKTINEFNKKVEDLGGQLQTANNTITALNTKLKDFENVDVKGLQDTIKKYEDDEKARQDADNKAKALQALKDRFAPLKGNKKFLNEGTVLAIPAENIVLYYIDPADGDFAELGLEYTTGNGETNLIGIHKEGNYGRVMGETHALMGIKLFAELIDGIAVVTFGAGA